MYPLDEIVLPKTIPDDLDDIVNKYGKPVKPHGTWRRVERAGQHKQAVQAYLATITFVDECIGVLLDGLGVESVCGEYDCYALGRPWVAFGREAKIWENPIMAGVVSGSVDGEGARDNTKKETVCWRCESD